MSEAIQKARKAIMMGDTANAIRYINLASRRGEISTTKALLIISKLQTLSATNNTALMTQVANELRKI